MMYLKSTFCCYTTILIIWEVKFDIDFYTKPIRCQGTRYKRVPKV